jgi:hypothetical protein
MLCRIAGAGLVALVGLAPGACKGNTAEGKPAVVEGAGELTAAEDGLLARRDALLSRRLELRQKKEDLDERRRAVVAQGGDTSEIDREEAELASSEGALVDEERSLNSKLDELLTQRRAMMEQLGGGPDVAGREAGVAARERELARREAKLAEREATLIDREAAAAKRWKDSCTVGGTTTIVQQVPADPRGTRYGKQDVEPLLRAARADMEKRGILPSDLPESVRGLEGEAGKAMAAGDYTTARLAAQQLASTVKGIKIDKGFIAAKIGRLNAAAKGKKLAAEAETLFREATASYGDGKFVEANRKLNKIWFSM